MTPLELLAREMTEHDEEVLKSFELGFQQGSYRLEKAMELIREQAAEIQRLRNKCKAERRRKRESR